jgi:hypothetical protein
MVFFDGWELHRIGRSLPAGLLHEREPTRGLTRPKEISNGRADPADDARSCRPHAAEGRATGAGAEARTATRL